MKKLIFIIGFFLTITSSIAQTAKFDLMTYVAPKNWQKEINKSAITYSYIDKKDKSWCQIGIFKNTLSKGNVDADFTSEWDSIVVKQYKTTKLPQTNIQHAEGWDIKSGASTFNFNNKESIVILTTFSGYGVCLSVVGVMPDQRYLTNLEQLLESVELQIPNIGNTNSSIDNNLISKSNNTTHDYAFTTTNFDDGWKSEIKENWVEVIKGNIKVLVHYPNKKTDVYNSVVLDGLKNAWNTLVAPRYSNASNMEFKPITGWQTIDFAEADMTDNESKQSVHVVFFKMHYSNGSGRYMEFITPNKPTFEKEFGPYHQTTSGWEKMENMVYYNRFALAATDLQGKWTSDFSGAIQYVNAYTGLDAGMDTHASVENFQFNSDAKYKWDIGIASGPVGNIKFQGKNSIGNFSTPNNWQISFSDIEGRARIYNAYFSCIKGLRILWLDNRPFAKSE